MKYPVKLAVFDIAGTLIEDNGIIVRTFLRTLELSGIPASEGEIKKLRGSAKRDVLKHFFSGRLGEGSLLEKKVDEAYLIFKQMLEESYKNDDIKSIAGAEKTIGWLRDRNILIATTTGFYSEVRDLVLKRLGWDGSFFDCNVCSDDVPVGRPAPYMIFQCISQLGIYHAKSVIAIGDTPLDMQAGCNAGCGGVIGVLTGSHGFETLGAVRHTHIIPSVADLPSLIEKEF
jgi:phosphonatase-like hydrolase